MGAIASEITTLAFAGNSPVTGEFPAQMASNAENVSIWWRHHGTVPTQRWKFPEGLIKLNTTIENPSYFFTT